MARKDAKAQRKNSLRLCDFARKKIKCLEEEKFKLAFTAGLSAAADRQGAKKKTLCASAPLREKKLPSAAMGYKGIKKLIGNTVEIA